MPWKSTAQDRWGHTPAGERALGGAAKVHEWDAATKAEPGGFSSLPSKKQKPKTRASLRGLESMSHT